MTRVNVTKSFLPPLEEYETYLREIWSRVHLTNQGPLLEEFEVQVRKYLDVDRFHFVANGTLALQVSLKALGITGGEVITTPFSFVGTTSAILWERCVPVFVDIEPDTFCIDPAKIEAAITPRTKAIMAVHVFGFPCDTEQIAFIAKKHKLKVIYDGAHAFGAMHKGRSLLDYGDISMCSFHATKVFHTIEGGAIIVKDDDIDKKVALIKNFGNIGDEHHMLGINAKASEFQAAMGLCNLRYVNELIAKKKRVADMYNQLLDDKVQKPIKQASTGHNYNYYPIVLRSESELLEKQRELNDKDIFPRRYFYPSLNKLPYLATDQACPISEDIAQRILCLPLYQDLEDGAVEKICEVVNT